MQDVSLEFASLLCSRLCHDLLSPVGALNNGLELLEDEQDPDMRAQCMALLADSARASTDKLKFFRLAFGAAGGYGDRMPAGEVRAALEGIVQGNRRVTLGWLVDAADLSRGATRILLNLALIAFDGLVRGGRLDVGVEGDEIVVRAEGPRLVLDEEIRAMLEGGDVASAMSARTAGAVLVRQLAGQDRRNLQFSQQDGVILFGVGGPGTAA